MNKNSENIKRNTGGHTARFFFLKFFFRKKTRRRGSRGWRLFSAPYPGVAPPRIRRTGPPSSDVFEKKFNLAKKLAKKIFFQYSFPCCILIVSGPILAFSAFGFSRYLFFEPWCATQNDPFSTEIGEKVFFGPQGVFLGRKNGVVGVQSNIQSKRPT